MSIVNYLRDTRAELKHVIWPTRSQAIWYTVGVIVVSVLVAAYLGFFDYLFTLGLAKLIG